MMLFICVLFSLFGELLSPLISRTRAKQVEGDAGGDLTPGKRARRASLPVRAPARLRGRGLAAAVRRSMAGGPARRLTCAYVQCPPRRSDRSDGMERVVLALWGVDEQHRRGRYGGVRCSGSLFAAGGTRAREKGTCWCKMVCERTVHRSALCGCTTHPISGQRHFSCQYSDPVSLNCGGHILQESRGDRWCPRCECVMNKGVLLRNIQRPPRRFSWSHYTKYIHSEDKLSLWTFVADYAGRIEPGAAWLSTVCMCDQYVGTEYVHAEVVN